jgi:hypothetical protein
VSTLSVLIPSRLAQGPDERLFLERAVQSIRGQRGHSHRVQILVGVDEGAEPPPGLERRLGVRFIQSGGKSQAAALNAAASGAEGDHVAILEDDDQWNDGFLFCAFSMLKQDFDFSSSTELEVTPEGAIIQVQEFPTPSGWVMRRAVWDEVGPFNEEYRFHLDNDWLGRLGETEARRVHLCEATTPMDYNTLPLSRPALGMLLERGKPKVALARHESPWPLVVRHCHPGSGMARIQADPVLKQGSDEEMARLFARFGRIPW